MERGGKKMAPGEFGYSVPSSCPSPSGEGTRERGSLLWVAYRLSRRWHLGSNPGRTCRAASLPRRRENKREGQPDDSLPVVDRYTARQSPACLHTNAQVVSIPSSCPSPSGEGTRGQRSLPGLAYRPSRGWHPALAVPERAGPSLSLRGGRTRGRENRTTASPSSTGIPPVNPLHVSTPTHGSSPCPNPPITRSPATGRI